MNYFQSHVEHGKSLISEALRSIEAQDMPGAVRALNTAAVLGHPIENLHLLRAVFLEKSALARHALDAVKEELDYFPHNTAAQQFHQTLSHGKKTKVVPDLPHNRPLISCVVPVAKNLGGFRAAIQSALSQNYPDIEVLAVLSPSYTETSATKEPASILRIDDTRLRMTVAPETGTSALIEYGLHLARGAYQLVLLDDSVRFSDNGLRTLAEYLYQAPHASFICTERGHLDQIGIPHAMRCGIQRWSRELLLDPRNLKPPTLTLSFTNTIWSKQLFQQAGNVMSRAHKAAYDFELFSRFFGHTIPTTMTVPLMLAKTPCEAYSEKLSETYKTEMLEIIESEQRHKPLTAEDRTAGQLVKLHLSNTPEHPDISLQGVPRQHHTNRQASPPLCHPSERQEIKLYGPRISIITPSFNQAHFLEETLDSILSQGYPNLEYIVIDGGSTDGSVEIIKRYAHHLTFWCSERDAGQYFAIQKGFDRSSGDVMTWLNSDDRLQPGALPLVALAFMHHPQIQWLTGRHGALREDGSTGIETRTIRRSRALYIRDGYDHPFIQQEGTFWRRSLWQQVGATLQISLSLAADMELWVRFFRFAQLHTIDASLALYRVHSTQRSQVFQAEYHREAEATLQRERDLLQRGLFTEMLPAPPIVSPTIPTRTNLNSAQGTPTNPVPYSAY